jgi:hypothetical protein
MTAEWFPIEAGHIMMFARSIGDFNPVYYESTSAGGGVIAPPTFVQASAQYDPEYRLRPRPGVAWFGSGRTPTGREPSEGGESEGGTGLHAEQHYEYHRPVRSGEVLGVTTRPGKTWEKEGRRGGLLKFHENIVEFRGEDGELVVVARSVGVRTGRTVKD